MAQRPRVLDNSVLASHESGGAATLAIFDLDRTLVVGSSLFLLATELSNAGLLDRRAVARAAIRNARYRRRGASDGSVDSVRRGVASLAVGREYEPIADVATEVGARLVSEMSPAARMLVDRHLLAGDFCVVLSATPQELVDAVVHALGAHRGVGTRAQIVDGHLTGQLDGPFCYGQGKLERLRTELGEVPLDTAWAYADSMSDLPVLTAVGWPIVVNPDRRLRRVARPQLACAQLLTPVPTLILLRHGKSDWHGHEADRDRPLSPRGGGRRLRWVASWRNSANYRIWRSPRRPFGPRTPSASR